MKPLLPLRLPFSPLGFVPPLTVGAPLRSRRAFSIFLASRLVGVVPYPAVRTSLVGGRVASTEAALWRGGVHCSPCCPVSDAQRRMSPPGLPRASTFPHRDL